jgi:hypothetical protein
VRTQKLAGEPDIVCTFTPHFSGSRPYVSSARLQSKAPVNTCKYEIQIICYYNPRRGRGTTLGGGGVWKAFVITVGKRAPPCQ